MIHCSTPTIEKTSAIVKNGSTVVIGGLIGESEEATETGVPFLKDVPLLGYLFKGRSVTRTRTELAIFLTPYVVFTDEDAEELLRQQRSQLQQSRHQIDSILPASPAPQKPQ